MSDRVLLNLLNELGKIDTMRGLPSIYHFFATSLINSVIQDHEYVLNSIHHFTLSVLWNCVQGMKSLRVCHI